MVEISTMKILMVGIRIITYVLPSEPKKVYLQPVLCNPMVTRCLLESSTHDYNYDHINNHITVLAGSSVPLPYSVDVSLREREMKRCFLDGGASKCLLFDPLLCIR